MVDDHVCDSWEELIKDSQTGQSTQTQVNKSNDKANVQNSTAMKKKSDSNSVQIQNSNTVPTILSRNSGDRSSSATSKNIQIKFEDTNANNQFMIQQNKVKILQRPREQTRNENRNNIIKNGFYNAKTIQEREAEYAKARLRILGADYNNDETSADQQSINNPPNQKAEHSNNLIRSAQGPSSGLNFTQRR